MGKDYSTASYKKSYNDDYVKVYEDSYARKKLDDKSKREYNTISKKLNDKPYSKAEKGVFEGLQPSSNVKGSVRAEGQRRTGRVPRPLSPQPQQVQSVQSRNIEKSTSATQAERSANSSNPVTSEKVINASDIIQSRKSASTTEAPPPFVEPKNVTKASTSAAEAKPAKESKPQFKKGDYSYVKRDSMIAPVVHLGDDKYRNIYTNENIDANEARDILQYAAYYPKPMFNLFLFFLICLVTSPLHVVTPLVIIGFGIMQRAKTTTTFAKKMGELVFPQFVMKASLEEQQEYSKRGNLYLATGLVIGIYQFITYII